MPADGAGLRANAEPVIQHLDAIPPRGDVDEDTVRHRLSRKARSSGPEGEGNVTRMREREERLHLGLGARAHDGAGNEAIDARIARVGDDVDRACQDARGISERVRERSSERVVLPGGRPARAELDELRHRPIRE